MPIVKLTGVRQRAAAGPEWNEVRATKAVVPSVERSVRHRTHPGTPAVPN